MSFKYGMHCVVCGTKISSFEYAELDGNGIHEHCIENYKKERASKAELEKLRLLAQIQGRAAVTVREVTRDEVCKEPADQAFEDFGKLAISMIFGKGR